MVFLRKVKTASGGTAVQIARKENRRDVVIEGTTRTYNRADRANPNSDLHFCDTCGCSTHWSATEGLIARMGGEVDLMGVNMRLFAPDRLSGIRLSFPDGRHWSGEGAWDYARDAAVMP